MGPPAAGIVSVSLPCVGWIWADACTATTQTARMAKTNRTAYDMGVNLQEKQSRCVLYISAGWPPPFRRLGLNAPPIHELALPRFDLTDATARGHVGCQPDVAADDRSGADRNPAE